MTRTKKFLSRAGAAALMTLAAPLAFAQTTTSTTTPGVPDTGVGGDAITTMAVLGVSAIAAIAAAMYLSYRGALGQ